MLSYLIRRLGLMIPALIIASAVVFFMGRLAPGDPVEILLGEEDATPELIEATREHYGLDKPVVIPPHPEPITGVLQSNASWATLDHPSSTFDIFTTRSQALSSSR